MTKIYSSIEVLVEVNGKRKRIMHRPYEMPVVCQGLRLYVEGYEPWAAHAAFQALGNMKKMVRFSVCAVGESWGPTSFQYPLKGYRWRSSSYNNTWASLVPYNQLYYHRGEDRGAIPDRLEVVEPITGRVVGTPVPGGDGASNGVIVENADGFFVRIAHMDIEHITPSLTLGSKVEMGSVIGKTGMTWSGRKSQKHDPHCHINVGYQTKDDTVRLSAFPYLMEAYFRDYTDSVLAVAGGYEFTLPHRRITLDGSRSICRPGQHIASYTWVLHNGKTVKGRIAKISYDAPGLYTEELKVKTTGGAVDRDFIQVRVWNASYGRKIAYGWVFQSPVRGVKVNDEVLYWNRLMNTKSPVTIDFGDGTPVTVMEKEISHAYSRPGRYVVTFSGYGPRNEPITEKLETIVEARR